MESKKYDDISVVQSVDGEIRFLTQLNAETQVWQLQSTKKLETQMNLSLQVSRPLAARLEQWLRSLLDWKPETRGKDFKE